MTRFESTTGKYIYLEVEGIEYRVYYEESGKGIPIVCQHTAGADGNQWRHFSTDTDITSKYRVIVPDLPYHGKSLPPERVEWWKQEYRLTKSFFIDFHLALKRALGLERPVFIGSSMGGQLAPDLALVCPDEYRAVIGLEACLKVEEDSRSGLLYFRHPRVNGAELIAALMYCSTGPTAPENYRREVTWMYNQGASGVFPGDLNYHLIEHDLRETAHLIDTSRCAVYIMNGEYDPGSGNIPAGEALVARIKGARFIPLYGVGHFPATEDFQAIKPSLISVLEEIAANSPRIKGASA
jgi:pimeloyl-ACP methyl ester carboxylesterase